MVRLKVGLSFKMFRNQIKFQFLSGAIKSHSVRGQSRHSSGFQFLSGAIKRSSLTAWTTAISPFQFLSGAIKSYAFIYQIQPIARFNSSVVRLKEVPGGSGVGNFFRFQFLDGAIKRVADFDPRQVMVSFNSSMVRLKAGGIFE